MKQLLLLTTIFIFNIAVFAQKQYEPGLIDLMPEGIVSIITDMTISPDGKKIALIGAYGKAYEFDITEKGKIKSGWKNVDITGTKMGAMINYTSDGKYLVLRGIKSTAIKVKTVTWSTKSSVWQGTDDMGVLDATTGKELLHILNGYFISVSGNTAFVSDKDGYKWYSLPDGKLTKQIDAADNECAAISPDGKYIVVSWDASKKMMQEVETVASRRSETKNARKAKKLVFIYKADDMTKPIKISSDEVDVVTNIDFDVAGKYAYLQIQMGGEENKTDMNIYAYERIILATGEIDRGFGMKGNFCKRTLDDSKVSNSFSSGTIGLLKDARIQQLGGGDEALASFTTRYKLFSNATYYTPVAMNNSENIAYVYYEKHLFEWHYDIVKKYFKKAMGAGEDEIVEQAKDKLDASITNGDMAKYITKAGITGDYIMDITIVGPKAMVQTVFCESDDKTNIKMQNDLKDLIRRFNFNIELPKERKIKFRYTFQI
ncbi:MAG: PD40 domain-containing protein [Deinococcales bacterium]|nr:PD40 domain-containing protein [Chitinophagaceae bacterium]